MLGRIFAAIVAVLVLLLLCRFIVRHIRGILRFIVILVLCVVGLALIFGGPATAAALGAIGWILMAVLMLFVAIVIILFIKG